MNFYELLIDSNFIKEDTDIIASLIKVDHTTFVRSGKWYNDNILALSKYTVLEYTYNVLLNTLKIKLLYEEV